ncbi:MAG TPA: hypothetical protein VHW05_13135 [Phenylobacterium sp.]|jgi:hypothetical protein|nr:hypothetical protein [Phenylobacterium sp.]
MRSRIALIALSIALTGPSAVAQGIAEDSASKPAPQGVQLDLSQAFHARSPWRLVVTEGPPTQDYGEGDAPGALTFCLRKGPAGPCVSAPITPPPRTVPAGDPAWEPHYLFKAKLVYPRGQKAAPYLLIVTGSLNSGDGDQIIATQLVAYNAARDRFHRVYADSTGRNNNEEIRYIEHGPLRGSVIDAEPQDHRPYGYWIVVDSLTSAGAYRQVLRYQSATRYNDGNPLAVIDSEMPNIERRLGLWKPGQPIPTPGLDGGKACPNPMLRHTELWCG